MSHEDPHHPAPEPRRATSSKREPQSESESAAAAFGSRINAQEKEEEEDHSWTMPLHKLKDVNPRLLLAKGIDPARRYGLGVALLVLPKTLMLLN